MGGDVLWIFWRSVTLCRSNSVYVPGRSPWSLLTVFLQDRVGQKAVSLDVRADEQTQILQITNYNPASSVYRPRHRASISIARQDTPTSSQDAFEAVTEDVPATLMFTLDLEGIGLSLMNRKMLEVVYLSMDTLKFEYSSSPVAQAVNLSLGTLQIDNQLHDAIYPVLLQPTPIPKEASAVASPPTIQASVIWLNDQGGTTPTTQRTSD